MGRLLGSFADAEELDRPDLNKCPDCGCFFPQDNCPLCGKPCPEEMRAGNRKPPKKAKKRRGSDRVVFVEWYYSWWFIILMLIFFPLGGLVLLISSPHKRGLKIGVAVVAILYGFLSTYGFAILGRIVGLLDRPVNTSLDRGEYVAACETLSGEAFYRGAADLEGEFVSLTATVDRRIDYIDEIYYLCTAGNATILIRDCLVADQIYLLPGDTVTVWGEGAGNVDVYDNADGIHTTAPCLNAAYIAWQK